MVEHGLFRLENFQSNLKNKSTDTTTAAMKLTMLCPNRKCECTCTKTKIFTYQPKYQIIKQNEHHRKYKRITTIKHQVVQHDIFHWTDYLYIISVFIGLSNIIIYCLIFNSCEVTKPSAT